MLLLAGPVSDCEVPAVTKQNHYGCPFSKKDQDRHKFVIRIAELAKGFVLLHLRFYFRLPRLRPGAVSPEREPSSLSTTTKARP